MSQCARGSHNKYRNPYGDHVLVLLGLSRAMLSVYYNVKRKSKAARRTISACLLVRRQDIPMGKAIPKLNEIQFDSVRRLLELEQWFFEFPTFVQNTTVPSYLAEHDNVTSQRHMKVIILCRPRSG